MVYIRCLKPCLHIQYIRQKDASTWRIRCASMCRTQTHFRYSLLTYALSVLRRQETLRNLSWCGQSNVLKVTREGYPRLTRWNTNSCNKRNTLGGDTVWFQSAFTTHGIGPSLKSAIFERRANTTFTSEAVESVSSVNQTSKSLSFEGTLDPLTPWYTNRVQPYIVQHFNMFKRGYLVNPAISISSGHLRSENRRPKHLQK